MALPGNGFKKFQNAQAVKTAVKKKNHGLAKKGAPGKHGRFIPGQGKEPANLSPKVDQIDAIKRAIAARAQKGKK